MSALLCCENLVVQVHLLLYPEPQEEQEHGTGVRIQSKRRRRRSQCSGGGERSSPAKRESIAAPESTRRRAATATATSGTTVATTTVTAATTDKKVTEEPTLSTILRVTNMPVPPSSGDRCRLETALHEEIEKRRVEEIEKRRVGSTHDGASDPPMPEILLSPGDHNGAGKSKNKNKCKSNVTRGEMCDTHTCSASGSYSEHTRHRTANHIHFTDHTEPAETQAETEAKAEAEAGVSSQASADFSALALVSRSSLPRASSHPSCDTDASTCLSSPASSAPASASAAGKKRARAVSNAPAWVVAGLQKTSGGNITLYRPSAPPPPLPPFPPSLPRPPSLAPLPVPAHLHSSPHPAAPPPPSRPPPPPSPHPHPPPHVQAQPPGRPSQPFTAAVTERNTTQPQWSDRASAQDLWASDDWATRQSSTWEGEGDEDVVEMGFESLYTPGKKKRPYSIIASQHTQHRVDDADDASPPQSSWMRIPVPRCHSLEVGERIAYTVTTLDEENWEPVESAPVEGQVLGIAASGTHQAEGSHGSDVQPSCAVYRVSLSGGVLAGGEVDLSWADITQCWVLREAAAGLPRSSRPGPGMDDIFDQIKARRAEL